ncbi:MAG: hypothetical protein LBK56_13990 [Gracilibacteraceae bacterium]|jgi:hypothetical protein|nr:hypothetical protein [Gracilibacteraceae bacterium]
MKKINFYRLLTLAGIAAALAACGAPPPETADPEPAPVSAWQSEIEDYFLSQHDEQNNDLVYFFIKKENPNEDAYAFIITDQMDGSERMECLVDYSASGDIPGFRTTETSADWYNDRSPVVIQDDHNGISMAAFSLPKDTVKIWILTQTVTLKDNQASNDAFPLIDFELSEESKQCYLINAGAGEDAGVIVSIDPAETADYFERTTFYATQVGTRFQPGYIAGKGQELMLIE